MTDSPLSIAVMVSGHGRGSNLGALIEGVQSGELNAKIALVIGTRADAPALLRAQEAGIHTTVVSPRKYEGDAQGYGDTLLRLLTKYEVELICLAGFMLRLPPHVVETYRNRIMNIHPALLPEFGGQGMFGGNVHTAVLERGAKQSGCTVHFVDENYDTGPVILQHTVPILKGDTPQTLAARVLTEEHRAYVEAVTLFAKRRIQVEGETVRILPPADINFGEPL
ncbi:phosphoribosylglycinamide formyltransferase [Armatimonadota bacterium]|nr:phosphoribosylglycinamide formyltransferase [Armatimonadota bacterium]